MTPGKLDCVSDESRLKAYRALVESRLDEILPSPNSLPKTLHEAMRYATLAPGKRIRPLFAMACAEAVAGDPRVAINAGCAAELIHCFSLIHDDLPCIDDDDLRRGRPTCHKVYGEALALLAGDALFALAFDVASTCHSDRAVSCEIVIALAKASGSMGLVGGEVMDVQAEGTSPDRESLTEIHRRKTGALIAASCKVGGIAAGASSQEISALTEFGQTIGLAFQVADDVLNETGDQRLIGKSVGSDREHGKATYAALLGIDGATAEATSLVETALGSLEGLSGDASTLRRLAAQCVERDR